MRASATVGAILSLAACASPAPFPEGPETTAPVGYSLFCQRVPDSVLCQAPASGESGTAASANGPPSGAPLRALVRSVHTELVERFEWAPDLEYWNQFEYWESHAALVARGESFKGDCEDFALTCAELLFNAGVQPSLLRIAVARTEDSELHVVCIAHTHLSDCRQRWVVPWMQPPYTWQRSMRLDEPGVWRLAPEATRGGHLR
jgi:predicted transglutaminase-like cysteine proteinase